jgi:hypothetical protein
MKFLTNIWLLLRSYPLAKVRVIEHLTSERVGEVKHLIAYRQVIEDLKLKGWSESSINGAIIQISVGFSYLFKEISFTKLFAILALLSILTLIAFVLLHKPELISQLAQYAIN